MMMFIWGIYFSQLRDNYIDMFVLYITLGQSNLELRMTKIQKEIEKIILQQDVPSYKNQVYTEYLLLFVLL